MRSKSAVTVVLPRTVARRPPCSRRIRWLIFRSALSWVSVWLAFHARPWANQRNLCDREKLIGVCLASRLKGAGRGTNRALGREQDDG